MSRQQIRNAAPRADEARRSHETDMLFRQLVRNERSQRVDLGHLVGQHDIEVESLQAPQQFGRAAGAQDDFDIVAAEQGPQEADLEIARQGCQCTYTNRLPHCSCLLQRAHEVAAGSEDCIGVVKRDPSRLGQMELTATPLEQRMAKPVLQLAYLHRQGGLRDIQPLRGASQVAVLRYSPEIAQVIIVHLGHCSFV
ncbi:hypothetical protein GCM10007973_07570 [Polymorphobacter multimanifer]|nr:hypothetical protein GCM10007973_07570 [Polymorphobacter multimanifer]